MTTTAPEVPPRRRWRHRWRQWWSARAWRARWDRLLRFLGLRRRPDPVDAPPRIPEPAPTRSEVFIEPSRPLERFRTPARGDGFTFVVQANVVWEGTATDDSPKNLRSAKDRVRQAIEERRRTIRQELMTVIRPIAREYAPFEAAALEEHLAETIPDLLATRVRTAKPTNADSADGRVDPHRSRGIHVPTNDGYQMRIYLWVDSCPEIRQLQQQIWLSVTVQAGQGLVNRQKLSELEQSQRAWREAITAMLRAMGVRDGNQARWTELLALQLAQAKDPEKAAEHILPRVLERYGQASDLSRHLSEYLWAADGSDGRVRTMDFALGSDTALTRLLDTLGVPDLDEVRENGLSQEDKDG